MRPGKGRHATVTALGYAPPMIGVRRTIAAATLLLVMSGCLPAADARPSIGSPPVGESPIPSRESRATPDPSGDPDPLTTDPLHAVELVDVRSGATFTLGQLAAEGPVLLETMAIWCVNCRAQQREVVTAHELASFHSVSLDVDPNERAEDLATYATELGFDWRFAVATSDLAAALRDRFGPAVLNPPSTPMVLLFPDGSVRALEFRGYGAEELVGEISAG
jgi:hypothetical protein